MVDPHRRVDQYHDSSLRLRGIGWISGMAPPIFANLLAASRSTNALRAALTTCVVPSIPVSYLASSRNASSRFDSRSRSPLLAPA